MTISIKNQLLEADIINGIASASEKITGPQADPVFEETLQEKIDRLNAPIKAKLDAKEAQSDHAMERIREVGFQQYMREQEEIKKLMKILQLMEEKVDEELKQHLEDFQEHFTQNPPDNIQQMYDYMDSFAMGVADEDLQERLQAMMIKIREMMEEGYAASDDEEEKDKPKDPIVAHSGWYL